MVADDERMAEVVEAAADPQRTSSAEIHRDIEAGPARMQICGSLSTSVHA